uniref:Uncharacterized protein n=1 Tax=Rhizophora mucronata TaxID=61149 RepID=A0A2P2QTP1_RHIMU
MGTMKLRERKIVCSSAPRFPNIDSSAPSVIIKISCEYPEFSFQGLQIIVKKQQS